MNKDWNSIKEKAKATNAPVARRLEPCHVTMDDEEVNLDFRFPLYLERFMSIRGALDVVKSAIYSVTGRDMVVNVETSYTKENE